MEIDTGVSLPVAQSPYTLPLKHYDWVRQEIETLEKSGVIERSLSRWAMNGLNRIDFSRSQKVDTVDRFG